MQAIVITDAERQAWDDFVMGCDAAIAWQMYGWSDVVRRHYQLDFHPIAVFAGSRITGILPLYHLGSARSGRGQLISVPYAVAGGVAAEDAFIEAALMDKAIELSRGLGNCRITLKQYKVKANGDLRLDGNYQNRELLLSGGPSEVWSRISDINRERITEAARLDATLDYPVTDTGTFHALLLRHHHRRGIPCVSRRWIDDLVAFGMYSIALLRVGQRIVAGTMVKEFKDTISLPFTCLAEDTPVPLAAYSLYWRLIERFASDGKRIFHSGRIPISDEAESYRLGWGGTPYPYFYQYYPNDSSKTEYAARRGGKRKLVESLWKRLPRPVASWLGPRIVRYFP